MDERRERLIDLSVALGALIIGALLFWQSLARTSDPGDRLRTELRTVEQNGIVHDASMALPAETRSAIGLDGQPGATSAGVLAELDSTILQGSASVELKLVWVALATSWRQDPLARQRIAEIASDPSELAAHRATLDELLRLANGKGADAISALEATFEGYGASRWLLSHLRQRHLANLGDPAAAPLAADVSEIARAAVTRWTIVGGLELFLLPTIGLVVLALFPLFLRQRLLDRGLAAELVPSPFRTERTWRVFFAWFASFQVTGYLVALTLAMLASGGQAIAITMALQALASTALILMYIELWARLPRDDRSVPVALGLAGGARVKTALIWAIPGIALAMALVRAADYLNLVLLGRPPDTQSVVQLVIDEASAPLMMLIGLGAVLLAPLAEEVVFRGFLFRNIRDSLGKGAAMGLSGLAFAAVHFEPTLLLPLTALGVALALLYEWSGSLYVPIAVHALWNLFALVKIELWRI